jgi:hypothetical protein
MDLILASIERAVHSGVFFPAIVTALTVPDIAGAVESPGQGSTRRYVVWFDQFFAGSHPLYGQHGIDGAVMYGLRCKLLHEGLSSPAAAPVAAKSTMAPARKPSPSTSDQGPQCTFARSATRGAAGPS